MSYYAFFFFWQLIGYPALLQKPCPNAFRALWDLCCTLIYHQKIPVHISWGRVDDNFWIEKELQCFINFYLTIKFEKFWNNPKIIKICFEDFWILNHPIFAWTLWCSIGEGDLGCLIWFCFLRIASFILLIGCNNGVELGLGGEPDFVFMDVLEVFQHFSKAFPPLVIFTNGDMNKRSPTCTRPCNASQNPPSSGSEFGSFNPSTLNFFFLTEILFFRFLIQIFHHFNEPSKLKDR